MSNEPKPGDYVSDHKGWTTNSRGELTSPWGHTRAGSNGPLRVVDGKVTN